MKQITEMSWESMDEDSGRVESPAWSDVEARLRRASNQRSAALFLKSATGATLSIGTDMGKGFVVSCSEQEADRCLLAPPSDRKGVVSMVLGFQPAHFPKRIVVNFDCAIEAAREFFQFGNVADSPDWTSDFQKVEA